MNDRTEVAPPLDGLRQLVERWKQIRLDDKGNVSRVATWAFTECADQLAALLAGPSPVQIDEKKADLTRVDDSQYGARSGTAASNEAKPLSEPKLLHETTALNPWQPERDPLTLALLGKLGEELSEAGAAVSRCIIQGIHESEPVTGKPNIDMLEDELADASAAGSLVIEHFELREQRMNARYDRKRKHLRAWHGLIRAALLSGGSPQEDRETGQKR